MISRIVAQHLGSKLKQTIVVENKPGANGMIAATFVARAAPDGYTLLMSTNSPHSAAPGLAKSMAYDPVKDFAPITRVGSYLFTLVVNPEVPAKSVPELIALAKASPGKLDLRQRQHHRDRGRRNVQAPGRHRYPARAVQERASGPQRPARRSDIDDVRRSHGEPAACQGQQITRPGGDDAGAQHAASRASVHAPGGVPEFEIDPWAGLFAPADTPGEIIKRLNSEVRAIVDSPEVKGISPTSDSNRSPAHRKSWATSSRSSWSSGPR